MPRRRRRDVDLENAFNLQLLVRGPTSRAQPGEIEQLVLHERQVCLVRTGENHQQVRSPAGRTSGVLSLALRFHGVISEDVRGEKFAAQLTWQPSTSMAGPSTVSPKPRKALLGGFQNGLDDRGLQLNRSKCECIRAKPRQLEPIPYRPCRGGLAATTSASRCWEPPSVPRRTGRRISCLLACCWSFRVPAFAYGKGRSRNLMRKQADRANNVGYRHRERP